MTSIAQPRKGERTRCILLDSARTIFARDGYLKAEISEIARAAGKSSGTFYIYFDNKSVVLDALIDAFCAAMAIQPLRRDETIYRQFGYQDLRETLGIIWTVYKHHAATFYALAQAAMIDEHFARRYRSVREQANVDFLGMIGGRQAQGKCRGLDPTYGARCLEILIVNCQHEWLASGGSDLQCAVNEERAFASLLHVFCAVLDLNESLGEVT